MKSVQSPAAPSCSVKGASHRLAVAGAAEIERHLKYGTMAADVGAVFVAEAFGAFGNEARYFVSRLISESLSIPHRWAPWEVVMCVLSVLYMLFLCLCVFLAFIVFLYTL